VQDQRGQGFYSLGANIDEHSYSPPNILTQSLSPSKDDPLDLLPCFSHSLFLGKEDFVDGQLE
jgi:hypothetical protein